MPEGDTIRYAAKRVGAALIGHEIRSLETPNHGIPGTAGPSAWPRGRCIPWTPTASICSSGSTVA